MTDRAEQLDERTERDIGAVIEAAQMPPIVSHAALILTTNILRQRIRELEWEAGNAAYVDRDHESLTPHEASLFLELIEESSGYADPDLNPLREKLGRIASKETIRVR